MSSSSSSPCAACKLQRRKCTQECIFAPYFPADQPQKFAYIHKVFGASNVAKLLNELSIHQREDAVHSLAYEAETRLRDPVYGCVGLISILQQKLKILQTELGNARKELAAYVGPQAMLPMIPAGPHMGALPAAHGHQPTGPLVIREPQQNMLQVGFDSHQEIYRGLYDQQKFDGAVTVAAGFDGIMLGGGYNHPTEMAAQQVAVVSPLLALGGTFEANPAYHQIQQPSSGGSFNPDQPNHGQHNFQAQLSLHPHPLHHQPPIVHQSEPREPQGSGNDEPKISCRSEGPSSC